MQFICAGFRWIGVRMLTTLSYLCGNRKAPNLLIPREIILNSHHAMKHCENSSEHATGKYLVYPWEELKCLQSLHQIKRFWKS